MSLFLSLLLSQLQPVDYTDHALVTFTPQSTLEAERIRNLGRFAGCCEPRGLGPQHRILTPAELNLAGQMGFSFEVTTNNVGQAIQEARAPQGLVGTSFFDDYRTNEEIDDFLDQLVATYPGVSRSVAGQSIEGRPIHFLRFGSGPQTVAITAGQHAREWINPAATLWMVENILKKANEGDRVFVDLLERTSWLVVPISNPDGYAYSHTTDRLWRKNRRNLFPNVGVDLNRNWGAGYGGPGSSSNPADETYRGVGAFSEPETAALQSLLEAEENLLMCLDIHSFGQLLLSPYGYQDSEPTEGMGPMLSGLAFDAALDMLGTHGSLYTPIPAHDLYLASGIASDWSWDDLGAPSWTFELRPVGGVGFLLPPDQIVPTGEELTEAVRSLAERLLLGRGRPIAGPSGLTSQLNQRLVSVLEPLPGRTMQGSTLYLDGPEGPIGFFTEDLGDNRIAANLQGVLLECTSGTTWWLEAFDNEGTTYRIPLDGGYPIRQGSGTVLFSGDGEASLGLEVINSSDLSDGAWSRGVPAGAGDRGDPTSDADGSGSCWLTDNVSGNSDVDGGSTTLRTPPVAGVDGNTQVTYSRWFHTVAGGNPGQDRFVVEASFDGGQTWQQVEEIGPGNADCGGGWRQVTVQASDLDGFVPTDAFQLQFTARDDDPGSVVEAGVDAIVIDRVGCDVLVEDLDGDGTVGFGDLVLLLSSFGPCDNCPADFNGNSAVDFEDLVRLLSAWG
ncbi:MAG: hypothetical protein EVA77_03825 [Phycisphaeraceae bacterium]|nr:MAG: hypothetical protein EVA77_03825 [Phycisphaeraceae bacterium]